MSIMNIKYYEHNGQYCGKILQIVVDTQCIYFNFFIFAIEKQFCLSVLKNKFLSFK